MGQNDFSRWDLRVLVFCVVELCLATTSGWHEGWLRETAAEASLLLFLADWQVTFAVTGGPVVRLSNDCALKPI